MARRVTLLTDFGTADGYVAAMKAVLATAAPEVLLDDAGHDLPRGDVEHAAWVLGRFWERFPTGTVHLVVVDPGVGTDRRALAVEAGGRLGVGPDNGVFTRILDGHPGWKAVSLPTPPASSTTFHGRDVFAPAAGRLAAGAPLSELGAPVVDPVRLDTARSPEGGTVRTVDRFGNLITDLPARALGRGVEVAGREVAAAVTYGAVAPGELLALVGSDGTVEVAVRDGSAARALGVGPGTRVRPLD